MAEAEVAAPVLDPVLDPVMDPVMDPIMGPLTVLGQDTPTLLHPIHLCRKPFRFLRSTWDTICTKDLRRLTQLMIPWVEHPRTFARDRRHTSLPENKFPALYITTNTKDGLPPDRTPTAITGSVITAPMILCAVPPPAHTIPSMDILILSLSRLFYMYTRLYCKKLCLNKPNLY